MSQSTTIGMLLLCISAAFAGEALAGSSWWIQFPSEGEVIQRSADDKADVVVRVFDPEDRPFRAAIDDGEEVAFSPGADHVQTCTLRGVPKGEHRLKVIGPDATKILDRIGVGDVHGAIGQSHTSGRSPVYWRSADGRTVDPTNRNESAQGSWFPLLSDILTQERGCPQKFVNMAWGGSPVKFWKPTPHRVGLPLYAADNIFKREGVKYVMFLIGATDAMHKTPRREYKRMVTETVTWLQGQGYTVLLGVMPSAENKLFKERLPVIQEATRELWNEIPGVLPGADLTKLDKTQCLDRTDQVHLNAEGYRRAVGLWAEAYRKEMLP